MDLEWIYFVGMRCSSLYYSSLQPFACIHLQMHPKFLEIILCEPRLHLNHHLNSSLILLSNTNQHIIVWGVLIICSSNFNFSVKWSYHSLKDYVLKSCASKSLCGGNASLPTLLKRSESLYQKATGSRLNLLDL